MTAIINKPARAERARNLGSLNGLHFVLISLQPPASPTQALLELHFFNANSLPAIVADITATPSHMRTIFPISGGHRLRAGSGASQVQVTGIAAGPDSNVLLLTVAPIGDYSTYTLEVDFTNIDPVFADIDFKFRPGCFTNECGPDLGALPPREPQPGIDYLAKDYDSFRHTLITAMGQRVAGWRPTSEADLDQVLIDLLSAAADELSDFQDRVMNEAYLGTARKRVSVARHARLMDYHIHQGNQASTWLALELAPATAGVLAVPFDAWTGPDPSFPDAQHFLAMGSQTVDALLNRFGLYTWSDAFPALAAGSTSADLRIDSGTAFDANLIRDHIRQQRVRHLLIEEWLNPATGREPDRDPRKRQLLELLPGDAGAETLQDPMTGDFLVRVAWRDEDALRFNYCFVVDCPPPLGRVEDVSLFHGNLVQATHGALRSVEFIEPTASILAPNQFHFERAARAGAPFGATCRLPDSLLAYANTPIGGEVPPKSTLAVTVTLPAVGIDQWDEEIDLIHSDDGDETGDSFIVETDERGRSVIRFGNGTNGRSLPSGATVQCSYQVGNPVDGNVGADAIASLEDAGDPLLVGATVWNPFDVTNGCAPELIADIIRRAPEAYRARQLRAITLHDYVDQAEDIMGVSRAAASYAWTGSWRTVRITIDPEGSTELSDTLRQQVAEALEAVRLIGEDIEIRPPRFIPVVVEVVLCANAEYWRADVKRVLVQEFSTGYTPDGRRGFFHPDEWTFGQELHASEIIGRAQQVTGVEHMISVSMRRWDGSAPPSASILALRPNEILLVENDADQMELGSIDFDVRGGRQ
jgi:hypothetical protein